jgi:hypothetical protein
MISNRKYKEILLNDAISADKPDFNAIENALKEAQEALVSEETLKKGQEVYEKLKYTKKVEESLQAALNEKDAEKVKAIIEKIENEKLPVDQKAFDSAKAALAKMK